MALSKADKDALVKLFDEVKLRNVLAPVEISLTVGDQKHTIVNIIKALTLVTDTRETRL